MAELIVTCPFDGRLPLEIGGVRAEDLGPMAITSVAPFQGQTQAVSKALEAQIGLGLPQVGQSLAREEGARVTWAGMGQFFVTGPELSPIEGAAITDQTDAWVGVELVGECARDVLARLTAIDLRPDTFVIGRSARAQIGHMNALLLRVGADVYAVFVFRSMAATLVHEIETAMRSVAARRALQSTLRLI